MAAQKGKDLLLKIDSNGLGNFITVAGLRARRIAFNAETVDITDADSAGRWRELLAGSGVQRVAVSGSGIFKDAASDASIRTRFFDGAIVEWQFVVPDFGTISTSPSSASRSSASRIGVRLTPKAEARSFSDNAAPGGISSATIWARSC